MAGDQVGAAAVDVLVVTDSDVVAAYEANLTTDRRALIRITPPFRARMRGRLHRLDVGAGDATASEHAGSEAPLHVPPVTLLTDPPDRPRPDETADALRASEAEYSRERHHERHLDEMAAWRDAVAAAIADRVSLRTDRGHLDARVATLTRHPE